MKRILTLLLAAGAFTAANAQPRDLGTYNRDAAVSNGPRVGYPGNAAFSYDRRFEIDRVNREYDARIQAVWNDRYLRHGEKKRITRDLDRERQFKIVEINRRCDAWERDRRNDRRYDDWRNGRH